MQEAKLAKEKMNGKLACGRPLVVRLASEKYLVETTDSSGKTAGEAHKSGLSVSSSGQTSRSAKIAAIKNKLKSMEEENRGMKRQKQEDSTLMQKQEDSTLPSTKT
ncbi:RNA-binding protein 18 [Actinidia chinensis var. chinensis]|uniref:RNA-binding protein 18 n=1 Tax=Actinidia chinensis var. chinensis TaxID=1590841 RepID=A0A2R6RSN2_ACTCC|nr:RNA-binding protein 18 [Actinidia chinensis var. chinensis]